MAYIIKTADNGRNYTWNRHKIDLPAFARDLAKELGGTVVPRENGDPSDSDTWQNIRVGTEELRLSANNHKGRVTVGIFAPDIKHDDRNTYDKTHRTEDATVNPDGRPIATIAKDIKRRVIDASQEALRKQREYAAEIAKSRDNFAAQLAKLQKAAPRLRIDHKTRDRQAGIYLPNCEHYISGRMDSDGKITIERMYSLTVEQFLAMLAAFGVDLAVTKEAAE